MYRKLSLGLSVMALLGAPAFAQNPVMPNPNQPVSVSETPAQAGNKNTLKHPFSGKKGMKITDESPLIKAIVAGNQTALRSMLQSKDALNKLTLDGSTPLIVATVKSTVKVMQLLTVNGADVSQHDQFGRTALHYAAIMGDTDKIKFLASLDPLADRPDKQGITPLYYAYLNDKTEAAAVLITDFGAQINQPDNTGNPLAFLVVKYNNNLAVIDHMIAQKLNLFKRNITNLSLADVAKKQKNKEVAVRLKAASDEQIKSYLEQQKTSAQKPVAP